MSKERVRNSRERLILLLGGALIGLALICASGRALEGDPSQDWGSSPLARLEALALLSTLNAELLSHESATLTLERWCEAHHLATPAKVTADRVRDLEKAASTQQRQELYVSSAELIRYRRVKLSCGPVLLSEADNWYAPSRLTVEMNKALDTTDTPFGKVVLPLGFQRHTLSAKLLWSPLPEGWEMASPPLFASTRVPESLLEHKALLLLPDGTPISEVIETYKRGILAFPVPTLRNPPH